MLLQKRVEHTQLDIIFFFITLNPNNPMKT